MSAESVNAQPDHPLEDERLDRGLGELRKDKLIEGPTITSKLLPCSSRLPRMADTPLALGWPSDERGGGVSISDSTIGNLALGDINISNVERLELLRGLGAPDRGARRATGGEEGSSGEFAYGEGHRHGRRRERRRPTDLRRLPASLRVRSRSLVLGYFAGEWIGGRTPRTV